MAHASIIKRSHPLQYTGMADIGRLIQQLRGHAIGVRNPPREEEEGPSTQKGAGVRKNRPFVPRVVHTPDQINKHAQTYLRDYGFRVSAELAMLWDLIARWNEGLSDADKQLLDHMTQKYTYLNAFGKFLVEITGKLQFQDRIRRSTDMVVLKQHHNSCGTEGVFFIPGYLENIIDIGFRWDTNDELPIKFWTNHESVIQDDFLIVVPIVTDVKFNHALIPGATAACRIDEDDSKHPYVELQYLSSFQARSSGRAGEKAISALRTVCRHLGVYYFKLDAVHAAKGFYVRQKLLTMNLCSAMFFALMKYNWADINKYSRTEIHGNIERYLINNMDDALDGGDDSDYSSVADRYEDFMDNVYEYMGKYNLEGLQFWAVFPFSEYSTWDWFIDLLNDGTVRPKPTSTISRQNEQSSLYLVNGNALCSHNNIGVPGLLEKKSKELTWGYHLGGVVYVKVDVSTGYKPTPFPLDPKQDVYISKLEVTDGATSLMVRQVLDAIVLWLGTYAPKTVNLCCKDSMGIIKPQFKHHLLEYGFTQRKEGSDYEIYLPLPRPPMKSQ